MENGVSIDHADNPDKNRRCGSRQTDFVGIVDFVDFVDSYCSAALNRKNRAGAADADAFSKRAVAAAKNQRNLFTSYLPSPPPPVPGTS